jgi:hypothetical protein
MSSAHPEAAAGARRPIEMSSGSTCTMRVSETHDSLSHGLDLVPLRPFSSPLQLRPRRHNLAPVNAKIEDTQGEAARAPPVPSPPVPPPGLSVPPRPLSSYDDMDGYEAGVRGTMDAAVFLQALVQTMPCAWCLCRRHAAARRGERRGSCGCGGGGAPQAGCLLPAGGGSSQQG